LAFLDTSFKNQISGRK